MSLLLCVTEMNGPKVPIASLSKIRLYAGKSGVSGSTSQERLGGDNLTSADNQQERPGYLPGILRDYTPDTAQAVKI